jgi:hypothetical protein
MRTINQRFRCIGQPKMGLGSGWEDLLYMDARQTPAESPITSTSPASSDAGSNWWGSLLGTVTNVAGTYFQSEASKAAAEAALSHARTGTTTTVTPQGGVIQSSSLPPSPSPVSDLLKSPVVWLLVAGAGYMMLRKKR